MTLVDTSVWVEHLRRGNDDLRLLLENGEVLCHPFIIGELACGSMKNRNEVLGLLQALPAVLLAEHDEVLRFLDEQRLYGRGLAWIDLHLLACASLSRAILWTHDRALKRAAEGIAVSQRQV